jgi:8-oxo-dGTP pyrophosphatase MutT (NUDIX family)
MRTSNQVGIIIFKKEEVETLFLILKRTPQRGDFWQAITGGIEEGETPEETAIREVYEEIGITEDIKLIDIDYSFEFFYDNETHLEKVFAVEVLPESEIIISEEHTEFKWVDGQTAIDGFLKYPGNKEAFKRLMEFLEKNK